MQPEAAAGSLISSRPAGQYRSQSCHIYEYGVIFIGHLLGIAGMAFCCCFPPYTQIEQGFAGVVTRFGSYDRSLDPGLSYIHPIVETVRIEDMRTRSLSLERQSLLTKDNITVDVDVIVVYKIVNIEVACFSIQSVDALLMQKAYSTIRSIVGTHNLQELLEKRSEIAVVVREHVEQDAQIWGLHVYAINIKDIVIPHEMIVAFSAAPIANRNAAAKIINAKADVEAAKLMREAADILATDAAMQIRYLEQVGKLAASSNTKVVFFPQTFSAGASLNTATTVQSVENLIKLDE